MGGMNVKSALRAGRCGSSQLGAVSDARSGEAKERVPLVSDMFSLRTKQTASGAQPNKSLKPTRVDAFRLPGSRRLAWIACPVWLSFFR